MKFIMERVSNPDIEPVTLAEMKRHLREFTDVTTNDTDISALIVAAREWVEDYTGRALIGQSWRITVGDRLDRYINGDRVAGYSPLFMGFGPQEWIAWIQRGEIQLHRAPVISVTSITSVDSSGAETVIDPATYELREADSKWPRVLPFNGVTWPTGILMIEYYAGFADRLGSPVQDASVVPERFKQAIKLWAEANYDRDPKTMQLLLDTAESIIRPERSSLPLA